MAGQPRILFCTGVFPPAIGGPGKIVEQLATALSNNGYKSIVLTFGGDDTINRPFSVARVSFSIPQPLRLLVMIVKTINLARKSDIIYSLDTYSSGFGAAIAAHLLRKPMIQRFSGDSVWESAFNAEKTSDNITDFQNKPHGLWTRLLLWRRNFILKTSQQIITDSEFLKNFLNNINSDANKVRVIRNPISALEHTDFDKEDFKKKNGLKTNVIMTMARLVPWKGVSLLIESMHDVLREHPDTSLAIAGTGPSEQELKKLTIGQNLNDSVIFLGNVTDPREKQKLYAVADVFSLNTFYESMSNVLLEAMAAGLPVVTTRAGGNPELVNNKNGILVHYNNKEQIAAAITKLLDDSELRQQLGENARQTVTQFTLEDFVNKNVSILKDVQPRTPQSKTL
ncbi:hypothetical protein BK004_01505 [bacterium CG10_46_32]|nr:MAG: hypothetical protein BK004_01505 [bacterium CG10_46_32]PIR56373.1 MAG: hypothetical protein COU73_01520 [Parcubacteria group bacterium CG10_big_fil_rev_8_21_14_0_10_46_32]